jgi:hypothetical protein
MELLGQPGLMRAFAPAAGWWAAALAGGTAWVTTAPEPWLGLGAIGAAIVGLVEAVRALAALSRQRRAADDWLRSATGGFVPPRYAWRARQLRAACERLRLAKTLRLIVRRAGEHPLGGYGAMRLAAVSENRDGLQLLASTLERVDQPVTPAGVLRVVDLITDGTGPLWNPPRGQALAETISSTLDLLSQEHPRAA